MNYIKKSFGVILLFTCFVSWQSSGNSGHKGHKNWCPEANLSDAQKDFFREKRKAFKAKTKDFSKDEKKEAKKDFWQDVLATVAESEEQKSALSECKKNKRKGRKEKHQR